MSVRVDTASLISGAVVCGVRGLGVLGSTILLTTGGGTDGDGILFDDVQAGDEGKEFRALITTWPTNGTLVVDEDGTAVYTGPGDTAAYQLYVDGKPITSTGAEGLDPQTITFSYSGDVTAPVLTSPTAAASGHNASTGSVSTNEANGTLYWLTNTSATATAAAVKAGSSQAVTATGTQNTTSSGLSPSTAYYTHFLHRDAAGNDSTVATSAQFTTAAAPDVTAPVLTSPTAAASGHNASTGSVDTNEANGTLYWLTSTSATATTAAVKAGSSQAVTAAGTQNTTSSGLSPSTGYYTHFLHRDAAGNDSTVATSAQFTTAAAPDVDPPVLSSPFAAASAYNASTGSVSTNEAGGTLYWLTNTSPSASAAAVKAGSSQAVAASGVQNTTSSGLSGSTLYYTHFLHRDAAGNDSVVASTGAFSTPAAPDVTPPTLTSPLGAAAGSTSSVGSVSTNEANGTLYWLTNTSVTATAAAVKAGQSKPVTATGTQSTTNSGLSPSTAYYTHFLHRDAAGNDSTVASSAVFNTSAPPAPGTAKRGAIGLHRRLGL